VVSHVTSTTFNYSGGSFVIIGLLPSTVDEIERILADPDNFE